MPVVFLNKDSKNPLLFTKYDSVSNAFLKFYFSHVLQVWKNEAIQAKLGIYLSKNFLLCGKMSFIKWSLFTRVAKSTSAQNWTSWPVFFDLPIPGKLEILWNYKSNGGICFTIIHNHLSLLCLCSRRDRDIWNNYFSVAQTSTTCFTLMAFVLSNINIKWTH